MTTRPSRSGAVQAPGAGRGAYGEITDRELAGKSPEFQQAFRDCLSKLTR